MAISPNTVWEVRGGGNDNNGGGFNFKNATPGTDFSQQNANQYTFTDLAATVATSAAPVITSASHNFVAADCGNMIHITAGTNWTPGWYEIVSVSANAATLDRACASAASPTAGTFFVGGSLLTIGQAGAAHVGGNTIWVKYNGGTGFASASTSSNVATGILTFAAGTTVQPTLLRGYETVRGDQTSNVPTLKWGTVPSGNLVAKANFATIEQMVIDGQAIGCMYAPTVPGNGIPGG